MTGYAKKVLIGAAFLGALGAGARAYAGESKACNMSPYGDVVSRLMKSPDMDSDRAINDVKMEKNLRSLIQIEMGKWQKTEDFGYVRGLLGDVGIGSDDKNLVTGTALLEVGIQDYIDGAGNCDGKLAQGEADAVYDANNNNVRYNAITNFLTRLTEKSQEAVRAVCYKISPSIIGYYRKQE